nr:hypothetical protein [Bacillus cereus]
MANSSCKIVFNKEQWQFIYDVVAEGVKKYGIEAFKAPEGYDPSKQSMASVKRPTKRKNIKGEELAKNGNNPTKKEKLLIKSQNLNPDNWLVYKKVDNKLHLVHRNTCTTRVIQSA